MDDRPGAGDRSRAGRTRPPGGWLLLGGAALLLVGFAAGRLSAPAQSLVAAAARPVPPAALELMPIQDSSPPDDPRELLPLPLPGPGQGPGFGLPQPGEGECPIYLYQDGQLFQLQPGQPGGPFPGGEGSPELFPLQPVPPSAPFPPRGPQPRDDGPPDLARGGAPLPGLLVASAARP